jgi:hypothetical protein
MSRAASSSWAPTTALWHWTTNVTRTSWTSRPSSSTRPPSRTRPTLTFIEDGGYERREFWDGAGWEYIKKENIAAPKHWYQPEPHSWWTERFGFDEPLAPNGPVVHVTWYEADAYARWAGKRLPTEAEWEKAASWDPETGTKRLYPWGDEEPVRGGDRANVDALAFRPAPVGAYPEGASAYGALGMIGDVWEWTASDFRAYPGFEAFPYPEYSEVFFGPDYKVLRGGSWATRPSAIRNTFRNWDYPIRRQLFVGFRCAKDAQGVNAESSKRYRPRLMLLSKNERSRTRAQAPDASANYATGKPSDQCRGPRDRGAGRRGKTTARRRPRRGQGGHRFGQ